jgi:UDP-N-acetylglucosamine 2-epimerase (non-hydrolysing)
MFKVVSVVGARPNFMKIAPLEREFRKHNNIQHITVHTGQHYDRAMSDVFFDQLGLSEPDKHLGVGSGGHGEMTGKIMIGFEQACLEIKPDLVIVVGDVNSTIAASLVARKLFVPVAHVEAGLRSFDETMPEEHNRRLTDHLSNLLFVSEPSGMDNLKREGIDMNRAHLVGDIMLETLQMFRPTIEKRKRWEDFGLSRRGYALVTLHRPSNVDDPQALKEIIEILKLFPIPIIFPIHPRTVGRIEEFGLGEELNSVPNLRLEAPESYVDFLSLMEGAKMLFSDSGSVQAETGLFNVPCLICRENTERPIYLERGTSSLVGRDKDKVGALVEAIQNNQYRQSSTDVADLGRDVAKKVVKTMVDYLA